MESGGQQGSTPGRSRRLCLAYSRTSEAHASPAWQVYSQAGRLQCAGTQCGGWGRPLLHDTPHSHTQPLASASRPNASASPQPAAGPTCVWLRLPQLCIAGWSPHDPDEQGCSPVGCPAAHQHSTAHQQHRRHHQGWDSVLPPDSTAQAGVKAHHRRCGGLTLSVTASVAVRRHPPSCTGPPVRGRAGPLPPLLEDGSLVDLPVCFS